LMGNDAMIRHDVSPYDYDLRGSLIEYTPHGPIAHSNSGKYPSSGLPGSMTVSVIFILFVWSTKTQFPFRLVTQILSLNSFFIFDLLWFMCQINYIQYNTSYIQCQGKSLQSDNYFYMPAKQRKNKSFIRAAALISLGLTA